MKNQWIYLTLAIVISLGAGIFIFTQNKPASDDAMMKQDNAMMEKKDDSTMMKADSRYVTHAEGVIEGAADTRRVLFFYASWCPTCRPADAEFSEKSAQIPEDVTVIRVNYNDPETDETEKALAKKYGVTYQHTYVQIDAQGNEVTKWNGGQLTELLAKIK